MARRQAPTSSDVALRAGVSRGTVSTVLNGARGNIRVSDQTRQRVLSAATELGYAPHAAAQSLRRQRSRIIGFVPNLHRGVPFEDPVSYLLSTHLAEAAMRRGYHLVEASAESAASRGSDELARFLLGWRVDGVVFDRPKTEGEVRRFVEHGLPVVQLMRPQFGVPTPTVAVDARPGIRAAVVHLTELGHRAIAFIGSGAQHPVDRARRDGFVAALADHGLATPDGYLRLGAYGAADGYAAAQALLALPARPTAILAAGDPLALGALRLLHEVRVRVPDELSLVSYDDAFAAELYPPLTSIAQPFAEIAEHAIALIVDGADEPANPGADVRHTALPTRLTIRHSTGPPDAAGTEANHQAL
jgi:LacI family transcriptional regulator